MSFAVRSFLSMLVGTALIFIGAPAYALNFQELQQKALSANPELQSLRYTYDSNQYLRNAAFSSYWPQLSLFAEETRRDVNSPSVVFVPATNSFSVLSQTSRENVQSYGARASVELFSGFSTAAQIDRAGADAETARSRLGLKSVDLRYQLSQAYIAWLVASKSVKTSTDIQKRQKQNLDLIKIKYDNGLEAKWAWDQAKVAYDLAGLQIETDRLELTTAENRLAQLIQEPITDFTVDPAYAVTALPADDRGLLDRHPQVMYYQSLAQQGDANRRLGRSEFFPLITASYTWSSAREAGEQEARQDAIALTLNWNLFNGFGSKNRLSAALAAVASAEMAEKAYRQSVTVDVTQQRASYELLRKTLQFKALELRAAESRAEIVSRQYRNGLRRYNEWEDAQLRLIGLEREILNYEKQALLKKAEWERSVGLKLGDT